MALLAVVVQGPVCIEYAASHPDLVTGLILCDAVAKIEGSWLAEALDDQMALERAEMALGRDIPVSIWDRILPPDEVAVVYNLLREGGASRRRGPGGTLAQMKWDASGLLGQVVASTLVLSSRNDLGIDLLSGQTYHGWNPERSVADG